MRITAKGQVTIPKFFRDKFGLFPGTAVQFVVRDGKLTIEKLSKGKKGRKHGAPPRR